MFPIEIFPEWAQNIILVSPIYTTVYAPAKMTVSFSYTMWVKITGIQLAYLTVALALMLFIYNKGVKKLNVNGG